MAWPANFTNGEVITHTRLNSVIAALSAWGGNVNGGGFALSNLTINCASIAINATPIVNTNLQVQISTAGPGTVCAFAANINGGYGLIIGYDEGATVTGAYIRNLAGDPIHVLVNGANQAMRIGADKKVTIGSGTVATTTLRVDGLPSYANNAAAVSAGHSAGNLYIVTSSNPAQVAIVV